MEPHTSVHISGLSVQSAGSNRAHRKIRFVWLGVLYGCLTRDDCLADPAGRFVKNRRQLHQGGGRSTLCLISGSTWKDGPTLDRIWSASCADSITTRSGLERPPLTRTPGSRETASAAVRPCPRHSLRVATMYVVIAAPCIICQIMRLHANGMPRPSYSETKPIGRQFRSRSLRAV